MTEQERIDQATDLILEYGGIDGSHHKMWVLDQVLRLLLGDRYEQAIAEYRNGSEYEWDEGIAP